MAKKKSVEENKFETFRTYLEKMGTSPVFSSITLTGPDKETEVIKGPAEPSEHDQQMANLKAQLDRANRDARNEKQRHRREIKKMEDAMTISRTILRVAAERMGGEFVALESEIEANDDGIIINEDEHGNYKVTVIPEWVRMAEDEPVAKVAVDTDNWDATGSYKITGTFTGSSANWTIPFTETK